MKRRKMLGLGVGLMLAISSCIPVSVFATTSDQAALQISEIHPKAVATASDLTADEYIELYNPNDVSVALDGYWVNYYSLNGTVPKILAVDQTATIMPRGYMAIRSSVTLADSGARLQLTLQGQPIQEVTYQSVSSGALSWSNYSDGWHLVAASPETASPSLSQPENGSSSKIEITEIVPVGNDEQPSFIELYNPNDSPVDIKNYTLRTISDTKTNDFTFDGSLVLAPGQYMAILAHENDIELSERGYVELYAADGHLASRSDRYPVLRDDYSWSSGGDSWSMTTTPTPNAANLLEAPLSKPLRITEMLPNPDGSDAGNEFIEIYNPNNEIVPLAGYELLIGTKRVSLPGNVEIRPGEFMSFHDTELGFSLTNTSLAVSLLAPSGELVFGPIAYADAPSGESWALVNDVWQFTDTVTETTPNIGHSVLEEDAVLSSTSLAPCEQGKYRNPLTNRCRTIETDASTLAVCDDGEYRNPETNRCRKIVLASADLTPCKEGQERNPETNRCRSIATDDTALAPCNEGYERNPSTNRCRKVLAASATTNGSGESASDAGSGQMSSGYVIAAVALVGAAGYGVYEWRSEIIGGIRKIAGRLRPKT